MVILHPHPLPPPSSGGKKNKNIIHLWSGSQFFRGLKKFDMEINCMYMYAGPFW